MLPYAALVADWVLTALWPLVGQAGLRHYAAVPFMCAGLVIGLACLAPFLAAGGRWRRLLARDAAPSLAAMGLLSGAATLLYITALNYTTPVNAVIIAQIEVLYSALISARYLGERPSLKQALASLLVVAGTAMIVLRDLRSPHLKGDLIVLCTPWMYQASHVFSKKLPRDLDALTLSGGRVFYGLVMTAPVALWSWSRGAAWSWEAPALRILLAQGVLMSSLNFVLWYAAIRGMELSKATTILLSYPALTLLFSFALGREEIGWAQVGGLSCT
ncbi:MAG: DMT family transporter, partial [Elusimicrobia bacterium]|nr:DMT family transporter [Elusimicrobiota bacterium]